MIEKKEIEKDFTKELAVLVPKLDLVSIKQQNKAKVWDTRLLTLTVDDSGNFVHNAKDIKEAVEKGIVVLKDNLEKTDSLDDVAMWKDNVNILFNWLEGTRKESTVNMDKLKKELSEPEKILDLMKPILKAKEDELNEKVFMIRKDSIVSAFNALKNESIELNNIIVDILVFNSFIELKKKIKTFDLNKSGKLGAPAIKQIEEEFNNYVNPLIEAKKLAEAKEKEQQFLTIQLSKINTVGTNEELQLNINELNSIEDTLNEYFPNIIDNAKSQILSLNKIIHNAIAQNDKIEKENKQNLKDINLLNIIGTVNMNSNDITSLKINLEDIENYEDLNNMLPRNRKLVDNFINELDTKIQTLKEYELKNIHVPIAKKEEYIHKDLNSVVKNNIADSSLHNDYFDDDIEEKVITKTKQYKLSESDIKFISEIKISAENGTVAVAMMADYIFNHLDMNGLEEVK